MSKNPVKSTHSGAKIGNGRAVASEQRPPQYELNQLRELQNKPSLSLDELRTLASQEYLLDVSENSVTETNSSVYSEMMDGADEHIEKLSDVLNIPLFRRAEFRRLIKECAAELSTTSHLDTTPKQSRIIVDEALAKSIKWPKEKYEEAPEKGKHGGLVSFLRRVWKPVLDEHNVVMPLSIFAKKDDEAAKSIYTLRRAKKKLPPDLFIMVETEVTEMRIATDPKGLAKQLIAGRRAKARIPGM